jgi:hypothetical protein
MIATLSYLSFYIAPKDTNNDGEVTTKNQHCVYLSGLNGESLTKVSEQAVKQYKWANENKEILFNFVSKNSF